MEDYIRLSDVLLNYWSALKGDKKLPSESAISCEDIQTIWDDCFLVLIPENARYKYEYLGKNLIAAYDDDIMREDVTELTSPSAKRIVREFGKTVRMKQPVYDAGEFINSKNMIVKYRQILLPFGNSKNVITHIFGGMSWRAF